MDILTRLSIPELRCNTTQAGQIGPHYLSWRGVTVEQTTGAGDTVTSENWSQCLTARIIPPPPYTNLFPFIIIIMMTGYPQHQQNGSKDRKMDGTGRRHGLC